MENNHFTQLASLVAKVYAGKDWHALSLREREIVGILELTGYLVVNDPPNGFVGPAVPRPHDRQQQLDLVHHQ